MHCFRFWSPICARLRLAASTFLLLMTLPAYAQVDISTPIPTSATKNPKDSPKTQSTDSLKAPVAMRSFAKRQRNLRRNTRRPKTSSAYWSLVRFHRNGVQANRPNGFQQLHPPAGEDSESRFRDCKVSDPAVSAAAARCDDPATAILDLRAGDMDGHVTLANVRRIEDKSKALATISEYITNCLTPRSKLPLALRQALDASVGVLALSGPDGALQYLCSVTRVSGNEVITARHCTFDEDSDTRISRAS